MLLFLATSFIHFSFAATLPKQVVYTSFSLHLPIFTGSQEAGRCQTLSV